jgi:predicted ester cyclase
MSAEENKAVVRRYVETWSKGKEAAMASIEDLYAPDYVMHGSGVFPDLDRAGMKQMGDKVVYTAFPDAHWVADDLIAEGDKVVLRYTFHGTHQGDLMGIPPTGKQVRFTGIEIVRIKDGKFVESWFNNDMLGLMQQLGAVPQMAKTGA